MPMETSRRRVEKLLTHLTGTTCPQLTTGLTSGHELRDDDVVIISAVRTPMCKAKRGAFASVHWTQLLSAVMSAACERIHMNPEIIEDIQVGTVLPQSGGGPPARMAQFAAGIPYTTCLSMTNRQCGSSLQAIAAISASIRSGYIEVGMAAGVESMSSHDMASSVGTVDDRLLENERARECLIPMGVTSDIVAERFNVTRSEQDAFALRSHQRALKAQQQGRFNEEIVPVTVRVQNENGSTSNVIVSKDDGIRATSLEALAKLRPAFKQGGTSTAGNSSQTSDGAAAVILTTRRKARELGFRPIGRFISFAVAGVPPDVMGIGPLKAIPKAISKAHLNISDIDLFEINEAFASQSIYCIRELALDHEKVNALGGSIALGHPLGATGARQVTTLLNQLRHNGQTYGVVSMCMATGMGAAAVLAAE